MARCEIHRDASDAWSANIVDSGYITAACFHRTRKCIKDDERISSHWRSYASELLALRTSGIK